MDYEKNASLRIVRLLTLLMGCIFALFIISDYYYYGTEDMFYASVALRGAGLLLALAVFYFSGRIKRYEKILLMVSLAELGIFVIYMVNLSVFKNKENTLRFMTVMLMVLTAFLIPNKWKNSLFAGCVILAGYAVFSLLFLPPSGSPGIAQQGLYLGICLVCCAIFLYGRESCQRRQFVAEQRLEFLSITDRLTEIYNRGRFEYILGNWIKSMRHDPFCLLFLDIDNFKKVNDRYGHSSGDRVLVSITGLVAQSIRDDDIFARWGGEEFVVLFGGTSLKRAAKLAERLRRKIEVAAHDGIGRVTVSIGVAQYRHGETKEDLVNRADAKMYEAKQAGKNRVAAENPDTPEPLAKFG